MKTAIIGFGPHGKRLMQVVSRITSLKLVGVVDSNALAFTDNLIRDDLKFAKTNDLYTVNPDIDVLLIATNGPSHAKLALEAMENSVRYIMVEKPMACSVKECNEMIDESKKKSVRLAVDKINRFDPVIQYIREKIQRENWGQLRSIYIQKPGIGLGCLGTHSFDLVNYLVGEDPLRVTGWIDDPIGKNPRGEQFRDPGGLVIVEYNKGIKGIISQIEDGAGPQTMEVHLTGARIYHDPKNSILDIKVRDLSVKPGPGKPPVYTDFKIPGDVNVKGDMLAQIESVLRELIDNKPMIADAYFGKSAVEILSATYISQQRGNVPVHLPLVSEEHINLYLPVT